MARTAESSGDVLSWKTGRPLVFWRNALNEKARAEALALQQLSTPLRRADLQHLCDTFIRKAMTRCSLILRESHAKVDVSRNI